MNSQTVMVSDVKPNLLQRWVVRPIVQQLTQGTSPRKISEALAYGVALGIFPIIGSTTLLALLVGVPLRLNQPILQTFKTLATPLQWGLVLGFYRLGEMLYGAPHVSLHIPSMIERFFAEPIPFFRDYGMTALYGVTVWFLVAPLLVTALVWTSRPLIERLATSLQKRRHA